jgi:two-component system, OmpR family, response regulator ChvI
MIVVSHNNSATTTKTTRLLLVDNEPDNTSVLSMGLEDEGYIVDAFTDPILALSNFKPNYYSLVILDINMPKMNGYDLYKEIRKLDNKVKICFLTASELYNENLRSQTKEILDEVKRFISKPLTIEDLVIKVKKELAEDSQ